MAAWRPFGVVNYPTWWVSEMRVDRATPAVHYRHVRGITTGMDVVWRIEPQGDEHRGDHRARLDRTPLAPHRPPGGGSWSSVQCSFTGSRRGRWRESAARRADGAEVSHGSSDASSSPGSAPSPPSVSAWPASGRDCGDGGRRSGASPASIPPLQVPDRRRGGRVPSHRPHRGAARAATGPLFPVHHRGDADGAGRCSLSTSGGRTSTGSAR